MRVAVFGGLTFQDRDWLWAGLDLIDTTIGRISEIIEGGRPGVDVRAQEWANRRERRCSTIPCQWERHSASAPFEQAQEMSKLLPDLVLATPCADPDIVAIPKAYQLRVVQLAKMPVAKTPGR